MLLDVWILMKSTVSQFFFVPSFSGCDSCGEAVSLYSHYEVSLSKTLNHQVANFGDRLAKNNQHVCLTF